jgi:hypothetical protein
MFAIALNTAPNAFIRNEDGTIRTWTKKNSAQKFRSAKKLDGIVVEHNPEAVTTVDGSVSAFLRAAAARFAKDKTSYKEFLAQAEATGIRRSLARRQYRKVHGAVFA